MIHQDGDLNDRYGRLAHAAKSRRRFQTLQEETTGTCGQPRSIGEGQPSHLAKPVPNGGTLRKNRWL